MWRLLKFQDFKYWLLTIFAIMSTFGQVITDLIVPALLSSLLPIIAYAGSDLDNSNLYTNINFLYWKLNFTSSDNAITILGISMAAVSIMGIIFGILGAFLASKVSVNLSKLIRSNLFIKIQSLSPSNLDKFGTSSLVTRLTNDVNQIQNMMFLSLRLLIRAPFMFIGGLIFALLTNLWLSISIVILIPMLVSAIILSGYYAIPLFKKNQKAVDTINIQSRESLLGIRVIKSFNLEANQRTKFAHVNKEWTTVSTKAFRIMTSLIPIVMFIANFATLVVLLIGRFEPQAGIYSDLPNPQGYTQILSFLQYQGYITMGLVMSVMVAVNYARSRVSSIRVNEVLNDKTDVPFVISDVKVNDGSIKFKNVNFKYSKDGENVLTDINIDIKPGQVVGVIGPTGSGKTSLVNLITRLYEINSGELLVGNNDVKQIDTINLRESVGYVLQENLLFSGTIKSNLLFGNEEASLKDINWALDISCASNFVGKFAEGIDHRVEQRGKNLSGGQKQRVSIARTVLRRPKIIVLDDSTSALDAITDKNLRNNIKTKLRNTTVVLVAQKILSIKDADQIVVLDKGKILGIGTHHELLQSCALYKDIAMSQMSSEELANE